MTFGEYIKSLRVSAGLKQQELADRVGISASMLSLLESSKREPTIKMIKELARALEVPSSALFATALAEGDDNSDIPAMKHLRALTDALARATQHAVAVARLRRDRHAE